jgi:hypothetical protein
VRDAGGCARRCDAMFVCECASAGPDALAPWQEVMDSYGIESEAPNSDPRFPHNCVASDARVLACGRLQSASVVTSALPHAPSEVAACRAAAARIEALLADRYVSRGDEGDHRWRAFSAPALEGERAAEAALVGEDELRSACGGALWPAVKYRCSPLAAEIARVREEDEENGAAEAEALQALADEAARELGLRALTFMRPVEPGGMQPAVYTFFIVGRTERGGLCGVFGHAVWT